MLYSITGARTTNPKRDDERDLWWWEGPPWPRNGSSRWLQVDDDNEVPPAVPPYEPEPPIEQHIQ
jgi:hypothetical protein